MDTVDFTPTKSMIVSSKPPLSNRPIVKQQEAGNEEEHLIAPTAYSENTVESMAAQQENQLAICNQFVYATCRDVLNDDEFESKLILTKKIVRYVSTKV